MEKCVCFCSMQKNKNLPQKTAVFFGQRQRNTGCMGDSYFAFLRMENALENLCKIDWVYECAAAQPFSNRGMSVKCLSWNR